MWRPEFIPFLRSRRISLNIDLSLAALLRRSSNIHRRRERRAYNEVLSTETRATRPSYYLQNFHFQSGGWMTDDSAERYDTQVEVLLNGAANAIRRQALPQLHEAFAGRDQRKLRLLVAAPGDSSISLSRPGRAFRPSDWTCRKLTSSMHSVI